MFMLTDIFLLGHKHLLVGGTRNRFSLNSKLQCLIFLLLQVYGMKSQFLGQYFSALQRDRKVEGFHAKIDDNLSVTSYKLKVKPTAIMF